MNIGNLILWGFAATLLLTTLLSVSRPLGLTRMDLPFILGTLFTANRNKAPGLGFVAHLIMGWLFAFIYGFAFESAGLAIWWFGLAIGFVHGAFVLSVGLETLTFIHPRMASPFQGPTPTRQLEPPGFFALNYGKGTPLVTLLGHLVYGAVLGTFYT
ncbi:hypothetical protein [Pontibacter liquoris]|uniref:hypothetical protein n=1 Tax=Pontibacter liquoris TaxID=2905677 RepID=UPI001FA732AF|nr:hypothetical protein [Pontibacter liquoris]